MLSETDIANLMSLRPMGQDAVSPDNLGLGFLYYGLVRSMRPGLVVALGSKRGFAPMCLGCGVRDNYNKGKLIFVDVGLEDDHWHREDIVAEYSALFQFPEGMFSFYRDRTANVFATITNGCLIDLCLIDADHTYDGAYSDLSTYGRCSRWILFHDRLNRSLEASPWVEPRPEKNHSCVDAANDWLRDHSDYEEIIIPAGTGLGIMRKKGKEGGDVDPRFRSCFFA